MKKFLQYYKFREEHGLADIDAMPNEDEIMLKLAKMAISRHRERFLEFLSSLSKNDDDIKHILNKFKDKQKNYMPKDLRTGNTNEKDVLAQSSADVSGPI